MEKHLDSTLHKNYSDDQLTGWFPGNKPPFHPGLYQLLLGRELYNGKFNGTYWMMFQGVSGFRLNEFQLKSIKWRGLNFKPSMEKAAEDFSKGWVFDWRNPGVFRPFKDGD